MDAKKMDPMALAKRSSKDRYCVRCCMCQTELARIGNFAEGGGDFVMFAPGWLPYKYDNVDPKKLVTWALTNHAQRSLLRGYRPSVRRPWDLAGVKELLAPDGPYAEYGTVEQRRRMVRVYQAPALPVWAECPKCKQARYLDLDVLDVKRTHGEGGSEADGTFVAKGRLIAGFDIPNRGFVPLEARDDLGDEDMLDLDQ